MIERTPIIYLVDDEPAVIKAVSRLLRSAGFEVEAFNSPRDFLADHEPGIPSCAVFDLAMPGIDGIQLQETLESRGSTLPIIFLTGRGDIPASVRAMKNGAIDFLTKPVDDTELIAAIGRALEKDRELRQAINDRSSVERRLAALTPREREVLEHVISGKLNKQIAFDLGIVEKTIKVHRARIMEKMEVTSLAELVRLTEKAGIDPVP